MLYCFEIDTDFLEIVLELGQVPLRSVLAILLFILLVGTSISPSVLDVVLVLLVDRVVRQMDIALVYIFLAVSVLLCGETHQALLEQVDLERVKASNQGVDT